MKSFLFIVLSCCISWSAYNQTTALTVDFKFIGIVEGYDHLCKTQVYIDDELIGESEEVKESEGGSFTVNVPKGFHDLYILNLAYYDGVWEEHTIDNDYSIDCLEKDTHEFKKNKEKIFLLFDIDDATSVSWKKMPKPNK